MAKHKRAKKEDYSSSSSSSSDDDRKSRKSRRKDNVDMLASGAVLYGRITGMIIAVFMLLVCVALVGFSIYALSDYDAYLRMVDEENARRARDDTLPPEDREKTDAMSKEGFYVLMVLGSIGAVCFGYLARAVYTNDRVASFFMIAALVSR